MAFPRASKALSRFTVLDLTRVRAGPTCVRQLADWGANVIKIEEPSGDPIRSIMPIPEVGGIKVLMGKQSAAIDVSTPEGCELVHALA